MSTFLVYAEEVMRRREEDGVRGIEREWSRFRCHIATAAFAQTEIGAVRGKDIREWLRDMSKKPCANDPTKTLSRASKERAKVLVSAIFQSAVEREIIESNPVAGIKERKVADESDCEEHWAYLTHDEQKAIASCEAIPRHDRLAILFAIYTGLRQGEQRHLELSDVALDGPRPHVHVRYAGRKNGKKLPPKSGKPRKVPLIKEAQDVTREWLDLLPTFAPHNPHGLVFPTCKGNIRQQGKPLGKTGTLKAYYLAAGITLRPHLHWHSLRHTCASSLIAGWWGRKWRIEEVQKVMGHSSVLITQRYAHLGEDSIAQAAAETVIADPIVSVDIPPETRPVEWSLRRSVRVVVTRVLDAMRSAS